MSDLFISFVSPICNNYAVIIEGDARVVFAYMLKDDAIISDVWLYNKICNEENSGNIHEMPSTCPREYMIDAFDCPLIQNEDDVEISWECADSYSVAKVSIKGKLIAILKDGAKPGWTALVKRDNPFALAIGRDNDTTDTTK